MRYQVTIKESAVVTLNTTYEVEAGSDDEAIAKAKAGDTEMLIAEEIDEVHNRETLDLPGMSTRVG